MKLINVFFRPKNITETQDLLRIAVSFIKGNMYYRLPKWWSIRKDEHWRYYNYTAIFICNANSNIVFYYDTDHVYRQHYYDTKGQETYFIKWTIGGNSERVELNN